MSSPAKPTRQAPPAHSSPQDVMRWGIEEFGDTLAICTSMQITGLVIIDMAARIAAETGKKFRVFTLDTGRLDYVTHQFIEKIERRYGFKMEIVQPDVGEVAAMITQHGRDLFYESIGKRKLCCEIRKVRPLNRKLASLGAWVTGVRRSQVNTRAAAAQVEIDEEHGGLFKLNPLADWTDDQVWAYIRENDVPTHPLYEDGYTSIGCGPCTRAPLDGETDTRAGRWWWEQGAEKECGIHVGSDGRVGREFDVLLKDLVAQPRA